MMTCYRYCCVPLCKNSKVKTPEKIFFNMPLDPVRRKKWCLAMKRDQVSAKSRLYVCEDHFDLENDMENYMQHKLQGGRPFLKKCVFPHAFSCQKPAPAPTTERTLRALKRRRKSIVNDLLTATQASASTLSPALPSTASAPSPASLSVPSTSDERVNLSSLPGLECKVEKTIQVFPEFRSRAINMTAKPQVEDSACSPLKPLMMGKGRNPSPPGGHVDFDYRSSFNARELEKAITRLKAVKKNVPFADIEFIREALERSLKVTTALSAKNPESSEVPQSISNTHESALTNCSSEENSKHKDVLNELISQQKSGNSKSLPYLIPNSEKIFEENREDELEVSFLRNKELKIKDNNFDHSSTKCYEYLSDDSSRSKIQERREPTEHRKHLKKSHREKKKGLETSKNSTYKDMLEKYEKDRKKEKKSNSSSNDESPKHSYKYRSNKRGGQSKSYSVSRHKRRCSSRSSDNSDYSYKHGSYRRNRRYRSRERVSGRRRRDSYSSDRSREYSPRYRSYSRRRRSIESISRSRSRSRDGISRRKFRGGYSSDSNPEYSPKTRSYRRDERCRSKESVSRSTSKDRASRKKYRESSYSSDSCSEYSKKNRSYKREEQLKSKDSALWKSVNVKSEIPSDAHSDSNLSVKAPANSLLELDVSGLSVEDFGNESQSARAFGVMREEKPYPLQPMPNQFKLSPRSEQNDNSLPYDPYDEGVFIGSENYYCKVCQKNLNGIACYETHINGKKHKKAEKALLRVEASSFDQVVQKKTKEPSFRQEILTSLKDGNRLDSSERAKFQDVIDQHYDNPIVGLEFLDELQYPDETISYYCNLCEAPCVQTSIFNHLIGFRHYRKFLKIIDLPYYERIRMKPKGQIQNKVRDILKDYENKHGRKKIKVKICLKESKPTPVDDADGLDPMELENQLNPAEFLDAAGNYHCKTCNAYMNNETMLHSHMVGKRHIKNLKKKNPGAVPSMPIASIKKEKDPKAQSRLERRLINYNENPIVGLSFIRETQNMNGENYICFICNSCTSIDIIEHITSMKHQIKYLETVDANKTIPNGIGSIRELEISDQHRCQLVRAECELIEKKDGRGNVEVYR